MVGRTAQIQVAEDPGGSRQFTTYYRYDGIDDLLGVCQGANFAADGSCPAANRSRQFTYDSLKRLTSTNNPESGLICYGTVSGSVCSASYDDNGNLQPDGAGAKW